MLFQEVDKVLKQINQETMSKLRIVFKDMLTCFYLEIVIQTLNALCKEKTLSILSNRSMIKDNSS